MSGRARASRRSEAAPTHIADAPLSGGPPVPPNPFASHSGSLAPHHHLRVASPSLLEQSFSVSAQHERLPGHASLPNGLGVSYPDSEGGSDVNGVAPNELTASGDRDWLAGTPWHKHVPARIEAA